MINFSVDYLEQADDNRNHITMTLENVRDQFEIKDKKVVEVGCGLARNLEIFRKSNEVFGIDGLPDAIEDIVSRGIEGVVANFEDGNLPVADSIFDVVICVDVLEHVNNAKPLVLEMKRIAKKDALFLLAVPNHFTLMGRLKLLWGSGMDMHNFFPGSDDWNNPHIRFFTYSGFHRFLSVTGLHTICDLSSFMTFHGLEKRNRMTSFISFAKRIASKKLPALFYGGFFVVAKGIDSNHVCSPLIDKD